MTIWSLDNWECFWWMAAYLVQWRETAPHICFFLVSIQWNDIYKLMSHPFVFFQVSWKNTDEWAIIKKPLCLYFAYMWDKWGTSCNLLVYMLLLFLFFWFFICWFFFFVFFSPLEHWTASTRCVKPNWSGWKRKTVKEWGYWGPVEGNSGV